MIGSIERNELKQLRYEVRSWEIDAEDMAGMAMRLLDLLEKVLHSVSELEQQREKGNG